MFKKEEKIFYGVHWFYEGNGRCHEAVKEFDNITEQNDFVKELLCQPNVWEIYKFITEEEQWKREGDRPRDFCYNY